MLTCSVEGCRAKHLRVEDKGQIIVDVCCEQCGWQGIYVTGTLCLGKDGLKSTHAIAAARREASSVRKKTGTL